MDSTIQQVATFAGAMIRTQDIDPVYPMLKHLNKLDGYAPSGGDALRRTLTYVGFYNIGASECVLEAAKRGHSQEVAEKLAGRAGTERRGLRNPAFLIKHFDYVAARQHESGGIAPYDDGLSRWLRHRWLPVMSEHERWRATTDTLMDVPYNGRWAAYKTCEILQRVHGWEISAPDAGHAHSTGPRKGLRDLIPEAPDGNKPEVIKELDVMTAGLQAELWRLGVPLDVAEMETILCNWHSLVEGRYYIGHDIDEVLEKVNVLPQSGEYAPVRSRLLAARRACFDESLLGELNGWIGVRRELLSRYAATGELVNVEVGQ